MPHLGDVKIFLSVGHGLTADQERFITGIRTLVEEQRVSLETLSRAAELDENPLLNIRNLINKTCGTLVIAFERLRIRSAIEYPDSDHEVHVTDWRLTTAWNQVEAAMSFQAGHRVLILCEGGLHQEGIIDEEMCARLYDRTSVQLIRFPRATSALQIPASVKQAVTRWTSDLVRAYASASLQT